MRHLLLEFLHCAQKRRLHRNPRSKYNPQACLLYTSLPIIVDPSHATGMVPLVEPMALAAVACGADGLMIEVHNNPSQALSDGAPVSYTHLPS